MIIGLLIRSGLLAGSIYFTNAAGVWGTPPETEILYNDLKNKIRPHVQSFEKQMQFEIPALPETAEINYLLKHYYNEGVKTSFNFIDMMPTHTFNIINIAKNKIEDFANSPRPED